MRTDEGLAPVKKQPPPEHRAAAISINPAVEETAQRGHMNAISIKDALAHMLATEHVGHNTAVPSAPIGHGRMTAHPVESLTSPRTPLAADDDD